MGVPNAQRYLSEENASLSETGYVYGSVASEALEACARMGEVGWTLCTLGSGSLLTNTVRTTYFCGKSYIQDKFRQFVSRNRSTSVIRSPRIEMGSRVKNKLLPDHQAGGPHTRFKYGSSGRVEKYTTFEKNSVTGKFVEVKRFRGVGQPHGEQQPPIIYDRLKGSGPGKSLKGRKPEKWELPSGY